jgi:hypothetical protein
MSGEPSVLDYVKARLMPWRGAPPAIPDAPRLPGSEADIKETTAVEAGPLQDSGPLAGRTSAMELPETALPPESPASLAVQTASRPEVTTGVWPWRSLVAVGLALFAQRALEPGPERAWQAGALFYLLATAWFVWAVWRKEWEISPLPAEEGRKDPLTVQPASLWIGMILAVLAFLSLGGNRFTALNLSLWIFSILFIIKGFWIPAPRASSWLSQARAFLSRPAWRPAVTRGTLFLLAASAVVIFFRVHRLSQVPPEMVSDHAEKLLDIWEVMHGETRIFFPRNTGREALQMYLTAAVIQLFGTGYSFLSMKIGTAIAGLLTLPFIYLLGKELGSKRAGLLALFLAGIAYWPNVITRVALRFTLYPLFVAPALYFLIRGLRRSNRNDFILAGLSLGIGLHGYTPIRILPFIVVIAVVLYLLHRQSGGQRKQAILHLALLAGVALVVFLPLLRFWFDSPELFGFRAFTRLGTLERPLPAPALQIFLSNLWNALVMFSWSNGEIWPVSISYRPALDVVSAALFHLGLVLLAARYLRRRNWVDLFLILSIPLLLMPSILSLAFPSENPAPNRGAGAMVPVFLIAGIALDSWMKTLVKHRGKRLAWGLGLALLLVSALQNYGLVFNEYQRAYTLLSWNTTEIGSVIREFSGSLGEPENAYVVAYPHWVDTRLVGINAGFPTKDYAIAPDNLAQTLGQPGPKLFVIYPQDESALAELQLLYPRGYLKTYPSQVEGKDFWTFYVLPEQ